MSGRVDWLEESAIVVDFFPGGVWVETSGSQGCFGCKASSCSTRWLSRWIPAPRLAVETELILSVGDQVRVGVPSRAFLQGALTMYGWPLLLAMAAGGVAEWLTSPENPFVPILFAGGLLLGMLTGRWHSRRRSRFYCPVLLAQE